MKMIETKPDKFVRFREFPELIFCQTEDGSFYFDVTLYLENNPKKQKFSIKDFDIAFTF